MASASKRSPEPDVPVSSEELTRHEEVANVRLNWVEDDTVHVRTWVESIQVDETVPRTIVYADTERGQPDEYDDGKVHELPDGSISIPVLEEQIVVTKRTVVRERIIVRKRAVTENVHIDDQVLREHVEVEASEGIEVVTAKKSRTRPLPLSSADPGRKV